jgi:hypothetical protein
VESDERELTEDERIIISVFAAQATPAKNVEPGDHTAGTVLNKHFRSLDHREMISAKTKTRKMHRLIDQTEHLHTTGKPSLREQQR